MKELITFTFDFLAYLIPGSLIVFSIFLLGIDFDSLDALIKFANGIKTGSAVVLVFAAYISGFAVNPIGRFLYKNLGFKIWKLKVENNVKLFISDKYVLIRQFSPLNFKYIEIWNIYCTMAHNLAVGSIVMFVVSLIKLVFIEKTNLLFWSAMAIVSLFLFFVFLQRAVVFSIWAANDINASVSKLKLQEKEIVDSKIVEK